MERYTICIVARYSFVRGCVILHYPRGVAIIVNTALLAVFFSAYVCVCCSRGLLASDTWWRCTFFLVTVPDQNHFRSRFVHRNVAPSAFVVIMLSILSGLAGLLTLVRLQGESAILIDNRRIVQRNLRQVPISREAERHLSLTVLLSTVGLLLTNDWFQTFRYFILNVLL